MDWIHQNRLRAAHLLLYAIIYSEDYLVQFLDNFLLALYRALLSDDPADSKSRALCLKVEECTYYLGRFCSPKSYSVFVLPALRNQLSQSITYAQTGALRAAGLLLRGSIEAIPLDAEDISEIDQFMSEFIQIFQDPDFQLDSTLAVHLIECLHNIMTMVAKRATNSKQDQVKDWLKPTVQKESQICTLLLQALAELEIGQLYGTGFKAETSLKASQNRANQCFNIMDILRGGELYCCVEKYSKQLLKETIMKSQEQNSDWSLHSEGFKYLASYILRFGHQQQQQQDEESKGQTSTIGWSELVGALSRVIEATSSLQMGKSCFKLLEILLKKSQEDWPKNEKVQKSVQKIIKEMVYFSGKEDKKKQKEHNSLFEMAKPMLLQLFSTQSLILGKASQESGLIQSLQLRLANTKLKDRKSILQVLRGMVEFKVDNQYMNDIWSGKFIHQNKQWSSITQIILQGFESTDSSVQYENAKTLQALVKAIIGNGVLAQKEASSIIPKWVMDILRSPLEVPFYVTSIPQEAMNAIKSETSSEMKQIEVLFKKPKEAISQLLAHAVDDTGSTRVEVIQTLVTLKKFAIPAALMKEMISARQKQSYKRCEVLLMLFL